MYARATTLEGSPEKMDDAVGQYRQSLSQFKEISGNQGAILLVDRASGRGIGITLWESEEAMSESRDQASQVRQQAASSVGAEIRSVEEYEVPVFQTSA